MQHWPRGRSYVDVSNFRAPYDKGYYQSGALQGLGALQAGLDQRQLPEKFRRYVVSGEKMGTFRRDLGSALNQVPRWLYGVLAVGGFGLAYLSYRRWKGGRATGATAQ